MQSERRPTAAGGSTVGNEGITRGGPNPLAQPVHDPPSQHRAPRGGDDEDRLADRGRAVASNREALAAAETVGQVAGEAGDGVTAISEYERVLPDIVLMDITMPQMEGIEAAEKIVRDHPDARIVMVSSVGYQENIVAALQRGARHFVQKPVKPEVLYEVIKYVMREDGVSAQGAGAGA